MQYLELLSKCEEATWYALRGDYQRNVERYVVSTPSSRDVCNRAELLGVDQNLALEAGMTAAFRHAPFRSFLADHPQERVCVVNFLRGGLNFEIRRALHSAYGFNRHSSAFMSSQRAREDGRWVVHEDMYRKLDIPKHAVLVLGDVVATGVTLENGFRVLLEHLVEIDSHVRGVVLFTIGCHKAEKVLSDFEIRARQAFPEYEKTVLVYLEGKFRLVDSKTELRIGIPGTDLIRPGALLAPELVLSQYQSPPFMLERCAIYDAGSRAFDIPRYVEDVLEYWEQLRELGRQGLRLSDAYEERWPAAPFAQREAFLEQARQWWRGVDEQLLIDIYEAHHAFRDAGDADALVALCDDRLDALRHVVESAR